MDRRFDFRVENQRQAYLDWLYDRSGRCCGTYTNLYQERAQQLVVREFETFCEQQ